MMDILERFVPLRIFEFMNVANGQGNVRKEFYTFKAEGHIWKSRATNLLIYQVISCFIAD